MCIYIYIYADYTCTYACITKSYGLNIFCILIYIYIYIYIYVIYIFFYMYTCGFEYSILHTYSIHTRVTSVCTSRSFTHLSKPPSVVRQRR